MAPTSFSRPWRDKGATVSRLGPSPLSVANRTDAQFEALVPPRFSCARSLCHNPWLSQCWTSAAVVLPSGVQYEHPAFSAALPFPRAQKLDGCQAQGV